MERTKQSEYRQAWLILTYKVPPEPARHRIALWRKLKAMGGIYLQNGVCVLPKTNEHVRRVRVLERDISSMGGEGFLLESVSLDDVQEQRIVERFKSERNEAYGEFVSRCDDFEAEIAKERQANKFIYAEVEENEEDLAKLRTWLGKIEKLDFFDAPQRQEAQARLARCAEILDDYAGEVFEREDSWTIAGDKGDHR